MTREEIFAGVCQCVRETRSIEKETIEPRDRLVGDLGLDSLDLLDLTFHLQQRFKVPFSPKDFEKQTRERMGNVPLEANGVYTAEALDALASAMPEVPGEEFAPGLTSAELPQRIRVATLVNSVARQLEESHA